MVEDENDEICMFDFTGGHLLHRISNVLTWRTIEQSRVNVELVSLSRAQNGGKETMNVMAENSKKVEVTYMTIVDT